MNESIIVNVCIRVSVDGPPPTETCQVNIWMVWGRGVYVCVGGSGVHRGATEQHHYTLAKYLCVHVWAHLWGFISSQQRVTALKSSNLCGNVYACRHAPCDDCLFVCFFIWVSFWLQEHIRVIFSRQLAAASSQHNFKARRQSFTSSRAAAVIQVH